jgi:hypothetical protein
MVCSFLFWDEFVKAWLLSVWAEITREAIWIWGLLLIYLLIYLFLVGLGFELRAFCLPSRLCTA